MRPGTTGDSAAPASAETPEGGGCYHADDSGDALPELSGETYDVSAIRDDGGFIPAGELEPMVERLRSQKNIVLQGPPGTGKTWLARRLGGPCATNVAAPASKWSSSTPL